MACQKNSHKNFTLSCDVLVCTWRKKHGILERMKEDMHPLLINVEMKK